jgi:hypothetical protein
MAEVHRLIVRQGVEEARRQALTKHERSVVEAAYQMLPIGLASAIRGSL